jgi:hypothetical protein
MIDIEKPRSKADPKLVIKMYDAGTMPSDIGAQLNISLTEVLDILEKRRRDLQPQDKVTKK